MGIDRAIYDIVDNPVVVGELGGTELQNPCAIKEALPKLIIPRFRLINLMWTKRVLIDDTDRALYTRKDADSQYFYMKEKPVQHSLSTKKVLYVLFNKEANHQQSIIIMDGYGQEWKPVLSNDVGSFTYLGRPICKNPKNKASTSRANSSIYRSNSTHSTIKTSTDCL